MNNNYLDLNNNVINQIKTEIEILTKSQKENKALAGNLFLLCEAILSILPLGLFTFQEFNNILTENIIPSIVRYYLIQLPILSVILNCGPIGLLISNKKTANKIKELNEQLKLEQETNSKIVKQHEISEFISKKTVNISTSSLEQQKIKELKELKLQLLLLNYEKNKDKFEIYFDNNDLDEYLLNLGYHSDNINILKDYINEQRNIRKRNK